MESFSLLKYLRGGAVAGNQRAAVSATTIAASACEEGGGGGGDVVDDDAAFFDLEFAVPGDESAASDAEEDRVEFNFSVAGDVASGGEVVAVEPVALVGEDGVGKEAELAATAADPPAASFLRPATKFRVLLLKLRKPKVPAPAEGNGGGVSPAAAAAKTSRFLIKFRVEDAPFVSLFTRDNSSRTSDAGAGAGASRPAALQAPQPSEAVAITAEERRFAKEVMLKYLNKIKPLYVKVSRRYGERLRFAGGASEGEETDAEPEPEPSPSATPSPAPSQPRAPAPQPVVVACGVRAPRASVPAGLKQACKRLGKSRSASSAVAAAPSPSQTPPTPTTQPQRRDDSLLQVQDGIQSAIAHCKRSFNASKGSESPLLRSMTDPTPSARLDGTADTKDGGDGA
uniref:Uncharacterized protein n=1 Tax=Avena sativa TaxID=4498 RepID=A0ACD5VN00_AVESA